MDIIAHEKYLEIDDNTSYQKGSVYKMYTSESPYVGVTLHFNNGVQRTILLEGTTIDGVEPADTDELYEYLKENLFNDGGARLGVQKATIQEVQDREDVEKYINPLVLAQYVEWFSQSLIRFDEDTWTDPPSSAQMNTKYPDARLRTTVYINNAGGAQLKYTKFTETQWESTPYTVA